MEDFPTPMLVVAALLRDREGRLLLQQALPGKAHEGLWELPGGKVDPGETPRAALAREIEEELGLTLDPEAMIPAGFADGPGSNGRPPIVLILYNCPQWSGAPAALDGQQWGWFDRAQVAALTLAPLDRSLLG
jgi:8-oxo-dGTP diphosphatase